MRLSLITKKNSIDYCVKTRSYNLKRSTIDIPVWERFCLTVEEAAAYFLIGEARLRELVNKNRHADFLLWVGETVRIKRRQFEKYLESVNYI